MKLTENNILQIINTIYIHPITIRTIILQPYIYRTNYHIKANMVSTHKGFYAFELFALTYFPLFTYYDTKQAVLRT